jgi:hypothetical protein
MSLNDMKNCASQQFEEASMSKMTELVKYSLLNHKVSMKKISVSSERASVKTFFKQTKSSKCSFQKFNMLNEVEQCRSMLECRMG